MSLSMAAATGILSHMKPASSRILSPFFALKFSFPYLILEVLSIPGG
jgi:hypothetical protein